MFCGKCNAVISPVKSAAVCISCETNYHPVCIKIKTLSNFKSIKDFWNCDLCLSKLKNVSTRNKKN
ncbi:Reverse transcriptase domain-containing protein [Aphis craccivora]|uniref:Reverse transcriptase domain-containing protein n=1 Tax=Aphis craccivora TaxID=307492 RepID=A0A6G0VUE6_APHCR|nr:Reverse transcriptase domain-containing protein [Aphis craccivora]